MEAQRHYAGQVLDEGIDYEGNFYQRLVLKFLFFLGVKLVLRRVGFLTS